MDRGTELEPEFPWTDPENTGDTMEQDSQDPFSSLGQDSLDLSSTFRGSVWAHEPWYTWPRQVRHNQDGCLNTQDGCHTQQYGCHTAALKTSVHGVPRVLL